MSADTVQETVTEPVFEHDITPEQWKNLVTVTNRPIFQFPIVTLSPTATVGKGRTNLTLIRPTILQTDTTTPYAGFEAVPGVNPTPGVSVHFTPSAYGITANGDYVFDFKITAYSNVVFELGGYAGAGTVVGAGTKTLNGNVYASVVLQNVPPNQVVYASINETSGGQWSWFSTSIGHPPLVFLP
jgi:hypothetical protein